MYANLRYDVFLLMPEILISFYLIFTLMLNSTNNF